MMKLFKGCLMTVGGLVGLIIVVSLFASSNPSNSGGSSSNSVSSSSKTSTSIPVGQSSDVRNDRSITIEKSESLDSVTSGNSYSKPVEAKGGKLIAVYMTLTNTGKESGNMFWTKFQLIDEKGLKYNEIEDFQEIVTIDSWLETQKLEKAGNQLFPGASSKTAKIFRVSTTASNLQILVNDKRLNIQ